MGSADFLTPDHSLLVTVLVSLVAAYGLGRTALALIFNLRHACRADRRYRPDAPLVAGPAIVRGTVVPEDDNAVNVQLTLQHHSTTGRYGTRHYYKEVARHGTARPFRLRLDSGVTLAIDPGERWTLVDELERAPRALTRQARLSAGETVVAVGHLVDSGELVAATAAGYREPAARALVLQPPAHEPMLLASGSLGRRYTLRARTWIPWLVAAVATTAFAQLVALSPYYDLVAHGQRVEAEITRLAFTPSHAKQPAQYVVYATTTRGEDVVANVDPATYRELHGGDRIPFVMIPRHPESAVIGEQAEASASTVTLLFALLVGVAFLEARQRRNRPWYQPHPYFES
jgi:hypothetical protein